MNEQARVVFSDCNRKTAVQVANSTICIGFYLSRSNPSHWPYSAVLLDKGKLSLFKYLHAYYVLDMPNLLCHHILFEILFPSSICVYDRQQF